MWAEDAVAKGEGSNPFVVAGWKSWKGWERAIADEIKMEAEGRKKQ
jgi:hypothetical protein